MAKPFRMFTSKVVPIDAENVDTDQIVPARYLKVTDKAGLAPLGAGGPEDLVEALALGLGLHLL